MIYNVRGVQQVASYERLGITIIKVTNAPQLPAPVEKAIITHEDEKIAVMFLLAGGFMV